MKNIRLFTLVLIVSFFSSVSAYAALGIKSISFDDLNSNEYIKIKQEAAQGKIGHIAVNMPWFAAIVNQANSPLVPLEFNTAQACENLGYVGYRYNQNISKFRCYRITVNKSRVAELHSLGVGFTFLLWGVPPDYAPDSCALKTSPLFNRYFCAPAPDRIDDFGDYAGMLAQNFKNLVDNYVIHNEVNANLWFYYDCINAANCNWPGTINEYAKNFKDAYDKILAQYGSAPVSVMVPLAGEEFRPPELTSHSSQAQSNNSSLTNRYIGKLNEMSRTMDDDAEYLEIQALQQQVPTVVRPVNFFINEFATKVGNRKWKLAPHGHPVPYASSDFSYGLGEHANTALTLGNMGMFVGYLHKTYSQLEHVWSDVHVTEVGLGFEGNNSSQIAQQTCKGFAGILGTPGISAVNWWYKASSNNDSDDRKLGIIDNAGNTRPLIYDAFHSMNSPANLSCGFELFHNGVLHTKVKRGDFSANSSRHTFTSRPLTSRFVEQSCKAFYLPRSKPAAPSQMLYECAYSEVPNTSLIYRTILSTNSQCTRSGSILVPMGPVGYAYTTQQNGTVPLYQCLSTNNADAEIFTTNAGDCYAGSIQNMDLYVRKQKPNGKLPASKNVIFIEYDDYLIPIISQ